MHVASPLQTRTGFVFLLALLMPFSSSGAEF